MKHRLHTILAISAAACLALAPAFITGCADAPTVASTTVTPLPPVVSLVASAATAELVKKYPEAAPLAIELSTALESAAIAGEKAPTPDVLAAKVNGWVKTLPVLAGLTADFNKLYANKIFPEIEKADNGAPALTQVAEIVRTSAAGTI